MWTVEVLIYYYYGGIDSLDRTDYVNIQAPTMAALLDKLIRRKPDSPKILAYRRLRYNGCIQTIRVLRHMLQSQCD
jgi:hypothetical protein